MSGEPVSESPHTATILLDHIRALRHPIPSETFPDDLTSVPPRPPKAGQGDLSNSTESSRPSNLTGSINGNHSDTQINAPLRSPPSSTQRIPRPAPYAALNSDDLTRTPKERLRAFLAPNSSAPSSGQSIQQPSVSSRKEPSMAASVSAVNPSFQSGADQSPQISGGPQSSLHTTVESTSEHDEKPTPDTAVATEPSSMTSNSTTTTTTSKSSPHIAPSQTHSSTPSVNVYSATKEAEVATMMDGDVSHGAAMQALSKDKQALVGRNEQLWKLVEKQRAMILSLNQDLEKVVKDRDRYRKRLKEKEKIIVALSNPSPPVAAPETSGSAELSQRTSPSKTTESQGLEDIQRANLDQPQSANPVQSADRPPASDKQETSEGGSVSSPLQPMETIRNEKKVNKSRKLPLRTEFGGDETQNGSEVALASAGTKSPVLSSPGESKRKAPPQPLVLNQAQDSGRSPRAEEAIDSGSDYDERLSPQVERGRRKTREEDDRLREVAFIEEEQRSRSTKQSKSKGKSKSKSQSAGQIASESEEKRLDSDRATESQKAVERPTGLNSKAGLPTSPRAAMLGGLQSPSQPAHESISTILGQNERSSPKPSNATKGHSQAADVPLKSPGLPLKSPGLPMSPRPGDRPDFAPAPRLPNQQLAGPGPMSPRSAMVLSPRAPRQPIPFPPNVPAGAVPSHIARPQQAPLSEFTQPKASADVRRGEATSASGYVNQINRELVSEQYPQFLLPPNAIPLIEVKVDSSRLRPSRNSYMSGKTGDEDSIFTLAVHSRSDGRQLWRVEKGIISLPLLDQSLKRSPDFNAKLPDRNLFAGHAPSKMDLRRAALVQYFTAVLETPLDEKSALAVCDFFSTDVIGVRAESPTFAADPGDGAVNSEPRRRKEGYLTKKGKQLGGWKARYFVLDGPEFRYYEGPHGGHLGSIRLHKAQIARQNADETAEDAEYRHAFMILEPKRRDSSSLIRHVLCAESDQERDGWVQALLGYVDAGEGDLGMTRNGPRQPPEQRAAPNSSEQRSISTASPLLGYDQATSADTTAQGTPSRSSESSSPLENSSEFGTPSILSPVDRPNISGPVAGGPIQNSQAWGNKSPTLRDGDLKKRNIFGFRSRTSEDLAHPQQQHLPQREGRGNLSVISGTNNYNGRPVFGISLNEAAEFFGPDGVDICLPAPVYRCIEYLEAKGACNEEGIFRMSGSNVVIKQIKERFNSEGDVKLLDGPYYDIHAVASLLKLYLRELPESVLTRELHLDFLKVLETDDKIQKASAVNVLVHRLPEANFELLATLSRFLIDIINNADVNKMNVRNVGIVFAPTLNIPAPLISLFLSDHNGIFGEPVPASSSPVIASLDSTPVPSTTKENSTAGLDLRSPRKQMFTDLATPAYNQTSFGPTVHGDMVHPRQQHYQESEANKADFGTGADYASRFHEPPQAVSVGPYRAVGRPVMPVDPDAGGFGSLNAALAAANTTQQSSSIRRADA